MSTTVSCGTAVAWATSRICSRYPFEDASHMAAINRSVINNINSQVKCARSICKVNHREQYMECQFSIISASEMPTYIQLKISKTIQM